MTPERIFAELRDVPGTTAAIRTVRKRISKDIAGLDRVGVLRLAHQLCGISSIGRWVAYELVQHHAPTMRSITRREVESLGEGMASWSEADTFACYISGPAWREGRIGDAVIESWSRSPDRWWRRAALVSTVPLNVQARGGHGDAKRTLAICQMLAADRDDMVVKALSWALRGLSEHDADGVQRFVAKHETELAARIIREVRNKLTTGLKNPRGGSPSPIGRH